MADVLEFIGDDFRHLPTGTPSVVIRIRSDFPTVASAGVKVYRDNDNGTISQVGQGVVIDTSANTPQSDTAVLALHGDGKYLVAFQGQATSVNGDGVEVRIEITRDGAAMLEDFGGSRKSADVTALINGAAYLSLAPVVAGVEA